MSGNGVAIVGAGIVGVACALSLQRDGFAVTLIDRAQPGAGTSSGNAGCLSPGSIVPLAMPGLLRQMPSWLLDSNGPLTVRPGYALKAAPWLVRFVAASRRSAVQAQAAALHDLLTPAIEAYAPLIEEAGASQLIHRRGHLVVYETMEGFAKDAGGWELRRRHGVPFDVLKGAELRQMVPDLSPGLAAGVLVPGNAHCTDPQRFCELMFEAFLRRGGAYLQRRADAILFRDNKPAKLRTDAGDVGFDSLVVAAGAWSHLLARQLGLRVPLESQRGYHVMLSRSSVSPSMPVVSGERKFIATTMDGGLRLGGTVEFGGLDGPEDWSRARSILDQARHLFPDLPPSHSSDAGIRLWSGHRPCLPDSLPVIGPSPRHANVFFAFGHGHLGLTGAAVTARAMSALLACRPPGMDLAPFRVDRFSRV